MEQSTGEIVLQNTLAVTHLDNLSLNSLAPLIAESEREGWHFLRRLGHDWDVDSNRFKQPGEALFAVWANGAIVGVCGLNVDPYADDATIGRVRRLYVGRAFRGRGIGRRLVHAVIEAAQGQFQVLRVRTTDVCAARLYEQLGFTATRGVPNCTHLLLLCTPESR
jgi:GNAT superfamily N-acetyltransferase